jgi:hypothetical protein
MMGFLPMTATAEAIANTADEEESSDAASQMDSLHILPLKIVPFKVRALNSACLIKNSRLETVVEMFKYEEGTSGQVDVNEVWTVLGCDPDDPELATDRGILSNLAALYSYDVSEKAAELADYMGAFTRPLLSQVYSGMETEIKDFDQLIGLFRSPDKDSALKNLQIMADKLEIGLGDIPKFLEDYGDIFMSLAYFRECLDSLVPKITELLDNLDDIRGNFQLKSDRNLMKTCDFMEEKLTDITTSLTGRFESFHQHSNKMWENVTAESFKSVRDMIAGHHMTLGGVLCGLAVKMDLWDTKFGNGRGGLVQRAEFIMVDMRHGMEIINRIEQSAPSIVDMQQ